MVRVKSRSFGTYDHPLYGVRTKDHHSTLLLDEPAEPLSPLSARKRLSGELKIVRKFVLEIVRIPLDPRTMPERNRAKRYRLGDDTLASNAPIGATVLLQIHQIADATFDLTGTQLKIRSRESRRVRKGLGTLFDRSDDVRQDRLVLKLVQIREGGSTTNPGPSHGHLFLSNFFFLAIHALGG